MLLLGRMQPSLDTMLWRTGRPYRLTLAHRGPVTGRCALPDEIKGSVLPGRVVEHPRPLLPDLQLYMFQSGCNAIAASYTSSTSATKPSLPIYLPRLASDRGNTIENAIRVIFILDLN